MTNVIVFIASFSRNSAGVMLAYSRGGLGPRHFYIGSEICWSHGAVFGSAMLHFFLVYPALRSF